MHFCHRFKVNKDDTILKSTKIKQTNIKIIYELQRLLYQINIISKSRKKIFRKLAVNTNITYLNLMIYLKAKLL